MTAEQAKARVELVRQAAGDDEHAHALEDALRADVLTAIAEGAHNARELATIALSTEAFNFARWCA